MWCGRLCAPGTPCGPEFQPIDDSFCWLLIVDVIVIVVLQDRTDFFLSVVSMNKNTIYKIVSSFMKIRLKRSSLLFVHFATQLMQLKMKILQFFVFKLELSADAK
ncbi:hypothetical protein HELRODRAFT_163740 [Helobdella robusta]|uniref:Uncharacterized protein n=1 Tax=Helobdella robusta TaxID=6412 RepID=T1EUE8_HELRO|nr:hypothetical protein HELRODRAFT_163740 [Helobdella robusta]ESN96647.1 hypothetical protein HELRODRAFT_163740 [Helobdella robusta]